MTTYKINYNNKLDILNIVSKDGLKIKDLPIHYKSDPEIVLNALNNNGLAFEFVNKIFQEHILFAIKATENNIDALQFAAENIRKDKYFEGNPHYIESSEEENIINCELENDEYLDCNNFINNYFQNKLGTCWLISIFTMVFFSSKTQKCAQSKIISEDIESIINQSIEKLKVIIPHGFNNDGNLKNSMFYTLKLFLINLSEKVLNSILANINNSTCQNINENSIAYNFFNIFLKNLDFKKVYSANNLYTYRLLNLLSVLFLNKFIDLNFINLTNLIDTKKENRNYYIYVYNLLNLNNPKLLGYTVETENHLTCFYSCNYEMKLVNNDFIISFNYKKFIEKLYELSIYLFYDDKSDINTSLKIHEVLDIFHENEYLGYCIYNRSTKDLFLFKNVINYKCEIFYEDNNIIYLDTNSTQQKRLYCTKIKELSINPIIFQDNINTNYFNYINNHFIINDFFQEKDYFDKYFEILINNSIIIKDYNLFSMVLDEEIDKNTQDKTFKNQNEKYQYIIKSELVTRYSNILSKLKNVANIATKEKFRKHPFIKVLFNW